MCVQPAAIASSYESGLSQSHSTQAITNGTSRSGSKGNVTSDPSADGHTLSVVSTLMAGFTGLCSADLRLEYPQVRLIGDLGYQGEIIPTKAGRVFPLPLLLIPIKTRKGNIVPDAILGLIDPNGGANPPQADFMHRTFLIRTLAVGTSLLCHD